MRCLRETGRLLRNDAEAQDAAQEALMRAWRQRASCRQPESPEPWVAQIARHEALRVIDARHRREIPLDSVAQALDAQGGVVGEHTATLDAVWLGQVLSGLSPADRALAVLHYVGDVSQVQLASALGLPETTVRVRLYRLRQRLKETLNECPSDRSPT